METPSLNAAVVELKRELATRERVYPAWVDKGKLALKVAMHRIECLHVAINALEQPQLIPPDKK